MVSAVDRVNTKVRIIDALIEDVVSGALESGAKLSEARLAERFGVSRMPVREALIELQRRGMVRIVPQVGTFVTKVTVVDMSDLYEVREALETQSVRLAAVRRSAADIDVLRGLIDAQQAVVDVGDAKQYALLDAAFHAAIFDASGSPRLREHYDLLTERLNRELLSLVVSRKPGRMSRSLAEHRRIVSALADGDEGRAAAAMREHIRFGRAELVDALDARDAAQRSEA